MSVRILERTGAIRMRTPFGEFSLEAFIVAEGASVDTHLAVVHGQLGDTVPVRINSACLTSEVFGDDRCDCAWQLEETLRRIVAEGSGVVLYHQNQEGRGIGLFRKIQSYRLMSEGLTTNQAFAALGEPTDARTYGAAASILHLLGVRRVRLISNNPTKARALRDAGLEIVEVAEVVGSHNPAWRSYLLSKAQDFGHTITLPARTTPVVS